MATIEVVAVPAVGELRRWLRGRLAETWGGAVARLGELVDARGLDAYVGLVDGAPAGAVTVAVRDGRVEIVTLEATVRRRGVGSALVSRAADRARAADVDELWLITTNDNAGAIAFYEAVGFSLVTRHAGAVDRARRTLKPSIPEIGEHGVPIRDELEFHLRL